MSNELKRTGSSLDAMLKQIHHTTNLSNALEDLCDERERLLQENDRLRAELLKAPNAQMVAFIAAFEVWIVQERSQFEVKNDGSSWDNGFEACIVKINHIQKTLKAKHMTEPEVGNVDMCLTCKHLYTGRDFIHYKLCLRTNSNVEFVRDCSIYEKEAATD